MFDAYTVKKVLPRLAIAVILIQLSWFLFTGMVTLTTAVAYGIEGLIYAPFGPPSAFELQNLLSEVNGGNGLFLGIAVGGAAALGFLGIALSLGLTALLAILIAFALLLFRQVLIVGLLLISPLALVAWILPNTEKFWKLWWESFSKLLLVYPMIVAVVAIGRVFAYITSGVEPGEGAQNLFEAVGMNDIIAVAFVCIGFFGPFFIIPKLFALAGSAFANVTGMVNDRSRGVFDRLRKGRQEKASEKLHDTREGNRFKGGDEHNLRGRLNRGLQTGMLAKEAGLRPDKWRSRMQTVKSEIAFDHAAEALEKNSALRAIKDNDSLLYAGMNGRGTEADVRSYLYNKEGQRGRELEQNVAAVMRAKREVGDHGFRVASAMAMAGTGTGYGDGPGEMLAAISSAADGDMALAGRMLAVARSNAANARRFDLQAGFGTSYKHLQAINADGGSKASQQAANIEMTDEALDVQGAGAILGGRGGSVKNLAPAMQRRITRAVDGVAKANASGDKQKLAQAQREMRQAFAATAGLLDVAAQVSPENARILADELLAGTVTDPGNGREDSVGNIIEAMRSDPNHGQEFGEMRREYGRQSQAQYASSQMQLAAQAAAQGGGATGVNPPPGGGPTVFP